MAFLNLSLFRALDSSWGPIWTPLVLGLASFALALIAVLIAALAKPGPELAMAEDFRKLSAIAVEADFQGDQVLGGLLGGSSFETGAAQLLIPALASIIAALRRKKTREKCAKSTLRNQKHHKMNPVRLPSGDACSYAAASASITSCPFP